MTIKALSGIPNKSAAAQVQGKGIISFNEAKLPQEVTKDNSQDPAVVHIQDLRADKLQLPKDYQNTDEFSKRKFIYQHHSNSP